MKKSQIVGSLVITIGLIPQISAGQYNPFQQAQIRSRLAQAKADREASEVEASRQRQAQYEQNEAQERERRAKMPPPTECQMKAAYAEYVTQNRQEGLAAGGVPEPFSGKLDPAWRERVAKRIYSDPNIFLVNPSLLAQQVYRECQAAAQADSQQYRGAFSMPPKN
ncbi:hypothetical protein [Burkholderia cepacia]|uniref:hypothetical protein n=1 Tax=Burkholderia cepacia TaxID=292 RepID=UPI002653D09E|nr:hypothetical protein [Burkholderia cepacia]MDN7913712.1 hypothetical protein [Burkholderia cepacia]